MVRFSESDVRAFAFWSGDRNPLHLDDEFARRTYFGRPLVHGVLAALAVLDRAAAGVHLALPARLDVEFRGAVAIGVACEATVTGGDQHTVLTLHTGDAEVLRMLWERGPAEPSAAGDRSWVPEAARTRALRTVAAVRATDDVRGRVEIAGTYPAPTADAPAAAAGLPATLARVLALSSYVVGMELPGLRSLFTRLTLELYGEAPPGDLLFRARVVRFDPGFRLLDTALEVATPHGAPVARATLRSYMPFCPADVDPAALASQVAPASARLRGTVALVTGGSRGLGAELASALALAGSHVYATARREDAGVRRLIAQLAALGGRLEFLEGDAGDAAWCARMAALIGERHGGLDLLVLNACAPPVPLRLGVASASARDAYVCDNLRLVEAPLSAAAPLLADRGGAIALVSSAFVDDPPPGCGPYVALKQAAEALLRSACREYPQLYGVVARPPALLTRWNDSPAAVVAAIAPGPVAASLVNHLGGEWRPSHVDQISDFSVPPAPEPVTPAFPLRLAATFTADPMVPALQFWMRELGVPARIDQAPYGQVLQSLLDPGSLLHAPGHGVNVVLLRVGDWLRDLPSTADAAARRRDALPDAAGQFVRAMRAHRARAGCETLLVLCPPADGMLDGERDLVAGIEDDLAASLVDVPGLRVARARDYFARYGLRDDQVHDRLRDGIAHMPYRDEAFWVIAAVVARHVHLATSPRRKVVVVDCDNTLWSGVVGEVGAEGLRIHETHQRLHRTLARLADGGTLVCLCSKNEEDDVWRVFDTRADLQLERAHVVAAAMNWQPKSQNLRTLAARLNLGLDSFIVIDDSPVECAEIRSACPEVLVLEWPDDPVRAAALLSHAWELEAAAATSEDRQRTELYRQEFRRQELRAGALTFQDFIDTLQLVVEMAPLGDVDLRRAAQLTTRTNQFNFTTIRRDEGELQALVAGGRHDLRTVRVRDRFGDYGLVGLVIAETGTPAWRVDTLLLSCRVLGRGVEHRVVAALAAAAGAAGATAITLRVDRTSRNAPAWVFLERMAPPASRRGDERQIEATLPVAVLSELRFEASAAASDEVADAVAPAAAASTADPGARARHREAAIRRAVFELSTIDALRAALSGRAVTAVPADEPDDVAAVVEQAFAEALRLPRSTVREIDRLEALGCDSLRIVEITVALSARYPWLPSTLLFEHRTVSRIVEEVGRLGHRAAPAAAPVPSTAAAPRAAAGDVAVVGMHLRCAGARSPAELWDLLSAGGAAVARVPARRRYFLRELRDKRPHWAGLLDDVDRFDEAFFGVSPREAEVMDPQLRLLLEVAWGALEDAGGAGSDRDRDTGVFVGVMYGDYGVRANADALTADSPYRCWEGFSLANRLSQLLEFRGPSLAVDTACSSSGTAIHLACSALRAGDCRTALVGGVNLVLDPDRLTALGRLGILSPRGRCEPFGRDADGTVIGEGAGVVVLRRLEDAQARGDRIYGVIKGTGLSTGSGTVGFTAPSPQAQAEAIGRALQAAGIDPRTISYVETHGTGTALGDPIEARGLTLAYGNPDRLDDDLTVEPRCALGSIKPNIGHLEAGAGLLGLIKVLLQLTRGQLVPSITSAEPNPKIPFADSPFLVQRHLRPWDRVLGRRHGEPIEIPRRAGLSSFGVGGANAHIIVEEGPQPAGAEPRPDSTVERPRHLLALSAPDAEGLARQAESVRQAIEKIGDAQVADFCYGINTGRQHLGCRVAVAAQTRADLIASLAAAGPGADRDGAPRGSASGGRAPTVAFLFTGQGCQYAGMGRELYATQPVFRAALDRCAAVFDRLLDRRLLDVLFAPEASADANRLHQTAYTQPALFAFEYAMSELWRSWGIQPDFVLGHSVGEIAAMTVAGGLSLDDGLTMIAARGRLMQALPAGGAMASVAADEATVLAAIAAHETLAVAAVNAPGQTVISGAAEAVAAVSDRLAAAGVRTKPLVVSHAFHSPLMTPMLDEFEQVVRGLTFSKPGLPLISGVSGRLAGDEVAAPDYWIRQVMEPVRFATGAATLHAGQVTAFVEVGPHPALLPMARQCLEDAGAIEWLPSARRDADAWETALHSLGRLYVRGADVSWTGFDRPYGRTRIPVPGYAFGGGRHWLRERTAHGGRSERPQERAHPAPASYEITWTRTPPGAEAAGRRAGGDTLLFVDGGGVGLDLERLLCADGVRTVTVIAGARFTRVGAASYVVNPGEGDDFERLWRELAWDGHAVRQVVYLWTLDAPDIGMLPPGSIGGRAREVLASLMHLVRALSGSSAALRVVTRGAVRTGSEPSSHPVHLLQSLVWGFGRTVALEHPELWGGLIDLPPDPSPSTPDLSAIARELTADDGEDQVALREGQRLVARLVERRWRPSRRALVREDAIYLITGGTGALGLHVARWMAGRGARHLVLTSRRGAGEPPVRDAIAALEREGCCVTVVVADVSQAHDVDTVVSLARGSGRPLRGVIHAAGVDTAASIAELAPRDLDAVLPSKVPGAWLLHQGTIDDRLDFFVSFSSMAAVVGAQGRAHYAAANAFLGALAHERRRRGLPAVTIDWGPWQGGGMAGDDLLRRFERIGNRGLDPDAAVDCLDTLIGGDAAQATVADVDWETFVRACGARRMPSMLAGLAPRPAPSPDAAPAGEAAEGADADWTAMLRRIPAAERQGRLEALVRGEVAATLGIPDAGHVPLERSFFDVGMDSLLSAELIGRLQQRTGVPCSRIVFDHPDVRSLAHALLAQLDLHPGTAAPPAPSRVPAAQAVAVGHLAGPEPAASAALAVAVVEPVDGRITGYSTAPPHEVVQFQRIAFPDRAPDLIAPRWEWMFGDSARRLGVEPRVWLYRDDTGRIVGQMGSVPVRLHVAEEERQTGWLVDSMVLEGFRDQAVGSRLLAAAQREQPFSLSLGQTAQVRGILLRLGWKVVAPLQIARRLVRAHNVVKGKLPGPAAWVAGLGLDASAALRDLRAGRPRLAVRPVERFGSTHDALWRTAARDVTCGVVRDASYLNWKYVDQPGQEFVRLELLDDSGVAGVAVWMFRAPDASYRYRRAFLVDLVAPLGDASTLQQVIAASCEAVTDMGADALHCLHIGGALTQALFACGFRLRPPERYLLVDPGGLNGRALEQVLSGRHWFVTQGDSDIDRPW